MRKTFASIFIAAALAFASATAFAQGSGPGPGPQPVPNPWVVNGNTLNPNGKKVITAASTATQAGFNLPQGVAPTLPVNGDLWATSGGVFARIGGTTFNLICSTCAQTNVINTFTVKQNFNLNGGALPTAQIGAVLQISQVAGTISRIENDSYAAAAIFSGVRADGTVASPTALVANDEIASINSFGYNGVSPGTNVGPFAAVRCYAANSWSSTLHGTYCDIATSPNTASSSMTEVIRFENDGGVTLPSTVTGGDKGVGTINAAGLFVNGVAVSTGGTPAGSSTQVQFNTGGAFAADAAFTFNTTGKILAAGVYQAGLSTATKFTLSAGVTSGTFPVALFQATQAATVTVFDIYPKGVASVGGLAAWFDICNADLTPSPSGATNCARTYSGTGDIGLTQFVQGGASVLPFNITASASLGFKIGSLQLDFAATTANTWTFGTGALVAITSGTASSSTTTGALVITGGLGISAALNVGGLANLTAGLTVTGTVSSENVLVGTGGTSGTGKIAVSGGNGNFQAWYELDANGTAQGYLTLTSSQDLAVYAAANNVQIFAAASNVATFDTSGNLNLITGVYKSGGTSGVTCATGLPSASFASTKGLVTHC